MTTRRDLRNECYKHSSCERCKYLCYPGCRVRVNGTIYAPMFYPDSILDDKVNLLPMYFYMFIIRAWRTARVLLASVMVGAAMTIGCYLTLALLMEVLGL